METKSKMTTDKARLSLWLDKDKIHELKVAAAEENLSVSKLVVKIFDQFKDNGNVSK
jgi:predicted DNA-binding ribbon-helix-helix protein